MHIENPVPPTISTVIQSNSLLSGNNLRVAPNKSALCYVHYCILIMKRRTFLSYTLKGLAGFSVLGGLYAWQVEPFWLEFVHMKMPVRHLPDHLVGKKLMQISDIHIGRRFDPGFIKEAFRKAGAFRPDWVVYTGDYVSTHEGKVLYESLEDVMDHAVQGSFGTAAILGNHDYGNNWKEPEVADRIAQVLSSRGIQVLRNAHTTIEDLQIIGLDDYWGTNFHPEKVMDHYSSSRPTILLCHNPDVCDLDIWNGYEGWILSGHTHGGQCKPPFLPPPMLPVKNRSYTSGKIGLAANRTLYINRALGHLWQVRFNVRPEITIFELEKEQEAANNG